MNHLHFNINIPPFKTTINLRLFLAEWVVLKSSDSCVSIKNFTVLQCEVVNTSANFLKKSWKSTCDLKHRKDNGWLPRWLVNVRFSLLGFKFFWKRPLTLAVLFMFPPQCGRGGGAGSVRCTATKDHWTHQAAFRHAAQYRIDLRATSQRCQPWNVQGIRCSRWVIEIKVPVIWSMVYKFFDAHRWIFTFTSVPSVV